MVKETSALRDFAVWASEYDDLEPDVVETLVGFKGDYLGDAVATRWTAEQLEELFLEWIPRKVTADERWRRAVAGLRRPDHPRLSHVPARHRSAAPRVGLCR